MFKIRKHTISEKSALDRRKLKENFYFFANEISEIGSDSIKRAQFSAENFTLDSFMEFESSGFDVTDIRKEYISGDQGTVVSAISAISSFDIHGDYSLSWNMQLDTARTYIQGKLRSGAGRMLCVVPYIGTNIVSSAEASYFEMGFINNSDCTDVLLKFSGDHHPRDSASALGKYEEVHEVWDLYGRHNRMEECDLMVGGFGGEGVGTIGSRIMPSQPQDIGADTRGSNTIHLSGSGFINMPRSSGSIGLVVYAQDGTVVEVESVNLSVRKRIR